MSDRLENRAWRQGPPNRHGSQSDAEGQEARERFRRLQRERDERDRLCTCRRPVFGYPKLGQRWCRLCGKADH